MNDSVRNLISAIPTSNGTPITPENLRWGATHEALTRAWIFDVLMGLANAIEAADDDAELKNLLRWKEEALQVLGQWELVWLALGKPGLLGESKPEAALKVVLNTPTEV